METSRQQEQQLRRMGREAVTKAIQAANANSGGMRRVTAKVTRVNSDYTVDVDMGDSAYSMPITGLRYTTSCFGVRVGDTVLVDVVGHLATVTGILATADNGPYVLRYGSYYLGSVAAQEQRLIHIKLDMPSAGYAIAVSNASVVSFWTKMRFSLCGDTRKDGFDVLCYNDDPTMPVSKAYFRWVALWVR
ncbi:hypothetical protein [Parolsenella catena]|uniref:hypothetical protein n=1 Tax=Parolsenella catena TaxID=2003188 RepID=UPI003A9467A6